MFNCEFYIIDRDVTFNELLEEPLIDWESTPKFTGLLDADFDPNHRLGRAGSFKTAHPGSLVTHSVAPAHMYNASTRTPAASHDPLAPIRPFLNKTVCVKQVFRKGEKDKTLKRYKSLPELSRIWLEVLCLKWGSAALSMVYHWMERQQRMLELSEITFPQMIFVRSMMAVATIGSESRTFLIEEFIDFHTEGPFIKYINNALPHPNEILVDDDLDRAEFLCFTQHVQWLKTHQMMFTSDYQGMCTIIVIGFRAHQSNLLNRWQDLVNRSSNPNVIKVSILDIVFAKCFSDNSDHRNANNTTPLFAGGNVGFDVFADATGHKCNYYCMHFQLDPIVRVGAVSIPGVQGEGSDCSGREGEGQSIGEETVDDENL